MKSWRTILISTLIGCALTSVLFIIARQPQGTPIALRPAPTQSPLIIHITGCVASPGVYELPLRSRVQDAVLKAGGSTDCADLEAVNLSALINDGQKINIPNVKTPLPSDSSTGEKNLSIPQTDPSSSSLVNINSATLAALQTLPGIGEVKAQAILAYRDEHGTFSTLEDLLNVPGIGEKTLDQIKDYITLDN